MTITQPQDYIILTSHTCNTQRQCIQAQFVELSVAANCTVGTGPFFDVVCMAAQSHPIK